MKIKRILIGCLMTVTGIHQACAQQNHQNGNGVLPCNCFVFPTLRPINTDTAIDDRTYREIRNKIFSSLATGQGQSGGLVSFGSFDPVAGSFKLNYTQELRLGDKKVTDHSPCAFCTTHPDDGGKAPNSWFLSLSAGGNVISNNIGVLFNNSKFNSGVNVTGKLFIPLGNSLIVSGLDADKLNDRRRALEVSRWTSKVQAFQSLDSEHIKVNIAYAQQKNQRSTTARNTLRTAISSLQPVSGAIDSLYKIRNQLDSMVKDSAMQQLKLDSLQDMLLIAENRHPNPDFGNYGFRLYHQIDTMFDKKLDSLNLSVPYDPYTIKWIALVGTFNRSSYYTYFDSLPYSEQISNGKLSVFNYGLEFNLIHFNLKSMHYLNFGLLRIRNNNISDLSTSSLSRQIKTSENDTTQTVSQTFNVYTSAISEYYAWNPYLNYYLFWGKTINNQAIHLLASAEFRDNNKSPVNLGIGYVFSFKNSKDNSVLNVEAFVKFIDVFKALPEQEARFYNRNTIGFQFGLPINIPAKQK